MSEFTPLELELLSFLQELEMHLVQKENIPPDVVISSAPFLRYIRTALAKYTGAANESR